MSDDVIVSGEALRRTRALLWRVGGHDNRETAAVLGMLPDPEGEPGDLVEHEGMIRWAATVMAREIELHGKARGDLLDEHTVKALVRHLREIATGERDPWGDLEEGKPTETTELPKSGQPYVEGSDTDLPEKVD